MYSERRSVVGEAVAWRSTSSGMNRVLPDGCMDLLWLGTELVVAGPDTTAYVAASPGGVAGVRFAAGVAPAFLGVPAAALRDQRVDLGDLWPTAQVRELNDRVGSSSDTLVAMEELALHWVRRSPPDPLMREVARHLDTSPVVRPVADLVGLSERQLHRRALSAYGYGAKTLGRILRLNRALSLARTGTDFATSAGRSGYVDQAHLARDVRSLTGTTLRQLLV